MEEFIDVDVLINEVKSHPILWNTSHEDYHDRHLKHRAWLDISKAMNPKLKERELKDYCIAVMKKWKNLRDNYMRNVKKQKQTGGAVKKKRYIYSNEMSFLNVNEMDVAEQGSSDNTDEVTDYYESNKRQHDVCTNEISETITSSTGTKGNMSLPLSENKFEMSTEINSSAIKESAAKRKKLLEETLIDFIKTSEPSVPDGDQSFFDSILPIVRQFNVDETLEFRTEVMRVIQNIRRNKTLSTNSRNLQIDPFHDDGSPQFNFQFVGDQKQTHFGEDSDPGLPAETIIGDYDMSENRVTEDVEIIVPY